MQPMKVSEDLKPLSEMKDSAGEIVRQVRETGRPVVLTEQGRGVAVVMSVDTYEELQALQDHLELLRGIQEAEQDIAAGRTTAHAAVVAEWEQRLGTRFDDEG